MSELNCNVKFTVIQYKAIVKVWIRNQKMRQNPYPNTHPTQGWYPSFYVLIHLLISFIYEMLILINLVLAGYHNNKYQIAPTRAPPPQYGVPPPQYGVPPPHAPPPPAPCHCGLFIDLCNSLAPALRCCSLIIQCCSGDPSVLFPV